MNTNARPQLFPYLGRFTLLFLATYFVIGLPFLALQSALPESGRIALDFYEPFRHFGFMAVAGQLLRGLAFALVFYPFYNILFENTRGRLILFGAMWGVALFGSVEPQPGSIEGSIYTTISFTEHLYALTAAALQMVLFVWLFFKWETLSRKKTGSVPYSSEENMKTQEGPGNLTDQENLKTQEGMEGPGSAEISGNLEEPGRTGSATASDSPGSFKSPAYAPEKLNGYTTRFLVVHLITYWFIGSIFYQIAGYADALEEMDVFEMWRDLENISAVLLVFFGQIFRGAILGLLLAPFYGNYINKKTGWLLLFLLMFGLTALGSPLFLPEFISFEGTFVEFLKDLVIGIPEIATQMLVFSLIFFWWQKKAERRK